VRDQNEKDEERKYDLTSEEKKRKEEKRRAKEKKREVQERQEAEAALESGFDHGFSNLASYNDREVQGMTDYRPSHSAVPAEAKQDKPAEADFQFDMGGEKKANQQVQKGNTFDLDDLLSNPGPSQPSAA